MDSATTLTEQLQRFSAGDREMAEAVLREVLPKLHQIAARELHRERFVAPLSPTELIHEVWLRNLRNGGWQVRSRQHFYNIAGLAMRRVLIDLARSRLALRSGKGNAAISLDDITRGQQPAVAGPEQIVAIGLLMEQLEKADPESARVVDLHYFSGFTLEEVSEISSSTLRKVRKRWEKGRDWLKDRMQG
jgi:RNA polymerase sigma factor (TIGR02999 family)